MVDDNVKFIRASIKGDRASYDTLIGQYSGFIYAMAFRMTGDHHLAEDLCQEIFLKAWLKLEKLKEPKAFPGWLAAIGRRTCLNAVDQQKRKQEVSDEGMSLPGEEPVMPASFDTSRVILEAAIARLSLRDRQLITLTYLQELSSAEVAEIMELEPGTIRVYLMRAREKLRNMLEGQKDELFT